LYTVLYTRTTTAMLYMPLRSGFGPSRLSYVGQWDVVPSRTACYINGVLGHGI
jgi:hypothetical protein